MNFLDKFRYSFDNLNEIENLKNEDKEKIIIKIKEIYSEADEHNDKSKEILEKIIKLLNG